jgi:hypothetical protein
MKPINKIIGTINLFLTAGYAACSEPQITPPQDRGQSRQPVAPAAACPEPIATVAEEDVIEDLRSAIVLTAKLHAEEVAKRRQTDADLRKFRDEYETYELERTKLDSKKAAEFESAMNSKERELAELRASQDAKVQELQDQLSELQAKETARKLQRKPSALSQVASTHAALGASPGREPRSAAAVDSGNGAHPTATPAAKLGDAELGKKNDEGAQ